MSFADNRPDSVEIYVQKYRISILVRKARYVEHRRIIRNSYWTFSSFALAPRGSNSWILPFLGFFFTFAPLLHVGVIWTINRWRMVVFWSKCKQFHQLRVEASSVLLHCSFINCPSPQYFIILHVIRSRSHPLSLSLIRIMKTRWGTPQPANHAPI